MERSLEQAGQAVEAEVIAGAIRRFAGDEPRAEAATMVEFDRDLQEFGFHALAFIPFVSAEELSGCMM